MRILFTLNSSNYGGMEKTVLDLTKGLDSKFERYVICPKGDLIEEFRKYSKVTLHKEIKRFDFGYLKFLINFLKQNKIEIIHSNEPRIVFHSLIAGFIAGTRVRISHTHTPISMWQIPLVNKLINIFLNSLIVNLFATYEIALTNSIKRQKIKELILSFKLKTISNCIDEEFLQNSDTYKKNNKGILAKIPHQNKFIFLCLSRLTKEKNQMQLIEAFNVVSKETPDTVLILAGKGTDFQILRKKVVALNLESKVFILTEVSETDKIDLYMNANCFVFPTLAEGFGITLLEAMYSCYPVLSSNLEVLREVSGNRLTYFKSGNLKSLISKMKEVLKYKEQDPVKLKNNKKFVKEKYSFENYVKNYEKIYS